MSVCKTILKFLFCVLLLFTGSSAIYAQYAGGISGDPLHWEGRYSPANCTPSVSNTATGGNADGHSTEIINNINCSPDVPFAGGISGEWQHWSGEYNPANCTPVISNTATGGVADGSANDYAGYINCNPNIPFFGGISGEWMHWAGQFNPANCTPTVSNTAAGGASDGHSYNAAVYTSCNLNIFAGGNSGSFSVGTGNLANCTPTISNVALGGNEDGHFTDTTLNSVCTAVDNPCSTMVAGAGSDVSICIYDSTQLQATGGTSYSWSPATGLNNPNIANPVAYPAVTTTYTVTVTSDTCSRTDDVIVTVNPKPSPTISGTTTICNGQSTTLSTQAGQAAYLWTPTGVATPSVTVSPTSTTVYSVQVTNSFTCDTTISTTVTVNPTPTASISGTLSICEGSSTMLTASGAGAGGTYLWSTGETSVSITVTPGSTTSYWVTATNSFGCTSAATYTTVVVNPYPAASISGTTTICQGSSTTLTASGGGTYLWAPGGETTVSITVSSAGAYSVDVASSGCTSPASVTVSVISSASISGTTTICTGQSTTLTANGGGASPVYSWAPGGETTASINVSPTNPPSASYNYSVTITDALCSSTANTTVTVNPLPAADAGSNTTICYGASTVIGTAPVGSNTYSWTPSAGLSSTTVSDPTASPTVTTSYTLTETMAVTLCQKSNSVTVTVVPKTTISGMTTTCSDVALTFVANGGGASPSYSWTQYGIPATPVTQPISGGTTLQTLVTTSSLNAGNTRFKVTVTDGTTGCVSKDSIDVTVILAPCPVVNVATGGNADGHAFGSMNNTFCSSVSFSGGNAGGNAGALGSFANCTPTISNIATGGIADGHTFGVMNLIMCNTSVFLGGNAGGNAGALGSFANCTPVLANSATGGVADGHAFSLAYYTNCSSNILFLGGNAGGNAGALGSFANCTPLTVNTARGGDGFSDGHHLDAPPTCMVRGLPVELLSFTAALNSKKNVLCEWKTASEINNDYFTVEKTADIKDFVELGKVKAAGNSTATLYYSLTDENPFTGLSYYRLKQTDYDGAFKYSELVPVQIGDDEKNVMVTIYPNPVTEKLTVFLTNNEMQNITFLITDILGREIFQMKKIAEKGNIRFTVNTGNFVQGVYILRVSGLTVPSLHRFVKIE